MRNNLFILKILISSFFMNFALFLKSHNICAFIIWLNIKKLNRNYLNNSNTKHFLVFPKSGGNEDLYQIYKNNRNINLIFSSIPRRLIKKIYLIFFKKDRKYDYKTKINNTRELKKKILYINFLSKVFKSLDKLYKFDGIISFNIFYFAEKPFDEICIKINKKFLVLHKESTFTPIEERWAKTVYSRDNEKSLASKIAVYSNMQKKILIESKIASSNQVTVTGCARSDFSFELRKIYPQKKTLVFYLIETNRGNNIINNTMKPNWTKLFKKTLSYTLEYAKKNPQIKIILKGKTGVHNTMHIKKKLPNNCFFVDGGSGEKFLKDAGTVLSFNSTILFETIASNRNLIIPNFNLENKYKKVFVYKIKDKNYFTNTKSDFFKKIDKYMKAKYKNKKLGNKEKIILKYYLGNPDGKSKTRLEKFLINNAS